MGGLVPSAKKRLLKASWVLVINVIFWVVLPRYLAGLISEAVPSTPLATPTFVYEFGAVITALQVMVALTEGMAVSVPFVSGSYLFGVYYLWVVTNGGSLGFNAGGRSIGLGFTLLLYILILPSIWGAIKAPLGFAIRRRSVKAHLAPQASSP